MKYDEATKLIKGLSKKYTISNDGKSVFELSYKHKFIAWVDKLQQFNFGRVNISASKFNGLPYSHKLYMILAELAMTPLSERKEHQWNVIIGKCDYSSDTIVWSKEDSLTVSYGRDIIIENALEYTDYRFTDDEFNDLIKYIKTLPDGEWQAKIAEHGKTLVKGE